MPQIANNVSGRDGVLWDDDTGNTPFELLVEIQSQLADTRLPRSLRYNPTYYLAGHVSVSVCNNVLVWEHWLNFQRQVFKLPVLSYSALANELGTSCKLTGGNRPPNQVTVRWALRDQVSADIWIRS